MGNNEKKYKRLFIILALLFLLIMIFLIIDFSRKTTFPGTRAIDPENRLEKLIVQKK